MKISEYIQALEAVKAEIGDAEVETEHFTFGRQTAPAPAAAFTMILKARQVRPRFWAPWYPEGDKGELVCKV